MGVWTPDGKRIAFHSNKEGPVNLFWQLADGSGGPGAVDHQRVRQCSESPGPRMGKLLAFHEINPTTGI